MAKTKELKKRSWGQERIVSVSFGSRLPCERLSFRCELEKRARKPTLTLTLTLTLALNPNPNLSHNPNPNPNTNTNPNPNPNPNPKPRALKQSTRGPCLTRTVITSPTSICQGLRRRRQHTCEHRRHSAVLTTLMQPQWQLWHEYAAHHPHVTQLLPCRLGWGGSRAPGFRSSSGMARQPGRP